ncbi:NADPH-dependent FMN reductase [Halorarius halobius]|uniref:NADPH-dependent FMN reductase n=1 Tax=Halorarius halobius TaxID=2962671 RepID=UPI0020CC5AC2|nr:NAD(P)H-dependent oxidoreductase [Halorarius halobius]
MSPNPSPDVVALCGSRRDGSVTRIALRTALDAAADRGATTTLVDLDDYELPPLDPDRPDAGDAPELRRVVDAADAVVLGTPNYHGSYSGVLKNALDYLGRDEFEGTTVGLLEVAGGSYPTPPLEHLRQVCRTLNAWTLPHQVAIPNSSSATEGGRLTDRALVSRIEELGEMCVEYAGVDAFPDAAPEAAAGD